MAELDVSELDVSEGNVSYLKVSELVATGGGDLAGGPGQEPDGPGPRSESNGSAFAAAASEVALVSLPSGLPADGTVRDVPASLRQFLS